ncbi:MAG: GNAT family N-acetyltransferase [Candidatus Eisenbacteria bacterium]|nr:GNAT family N-acetyltransferase [Candidatus Eisenbacteria bacterium]
MPEPSAHVVRPIDPDSADEIALVAARMKLTLIEVLGEREGGTLYTREWLEDRVRFHLDPERCQGRVFVAIAPGGEVSGHCIVRVEQDAAGREFGLFSTTYVAPEARRAGVAAALVARGEAWLREAGMREMETYTAESNTALIALFESRGYAVTLRVPDKRMVVLGRTLD